MIVKREPKGDTKDAVKLSKFFSNKDNTVYPIQSDLQRRYCWPAAYIDKLFKDYLVDLYVKNEEADKNGDDGLFAKIGDAILTRVEDNYNGTMCRKQEIIDMSQRITTIEAIIVVMLYIHMRNNGIEDETERKEMYYKYLKTKNGSSFKVISTFNDSDLEEVIEECITGNFKTDTKTIKTLTKCFNETNAKKNEVTYKTFRSICAYVYSLIDSTIGVDDTTILDRLTLFLDKTYIQVEECDKEDRVTKFKEVNTYRVGIANQDIYKTLLCAKGDRIDAKFQDFEAKVTAICTPKRINILKTPISVSEYIMKIGLIVLDDTHETCKFAFSLEDEKNGLVYHINNGLLDTEDKILKYLDICIDVCNFLLKSMDYQQEGFNEDWYLLTENHTRSFIWLYNILPAYAISTLKDDDKKSYAFEMLLKSFTVYSIKYSTNRSVQYIQTYMYSFAKEIFEKGDATYCAEDFKTALYVIYKETFGDFINKELTKTVKRLDYSQASCKSGIYAILSCFEYIAQKACGIKRDNLYRLTKKNEIEIEHILPQSQENEHNEAFIGSIGNLTFLEKSLNASKQDDTTSTADRYSDSSFITTKLMVDGNRYEGLTNQQIEALRANVIPFTTDKDTINNFETGIIDRSNAIAMRIRDFLN
jgi:hypothetical protein